jgi:4-hydroxybenzoate polyprenyltransferase
LGFFVDMRKLFRFWALLNILSVDVAIGAVISAGFFARLCQVQLLPQGLLVLGITVWLIYTIDHLVDARWVNHPASSERHRFHQRFFKHLTIACVILLMIDLALLVFVRKPILLVGIAFSGAVGIYIILNRRMTYLKELMAGALYTAGILLPSWALGCRPITKGQLVVMGCFMLIVWINLFVFAWMSVEQDNADKQHSLFTQLGRDAGRSIIWVLFGLLAVGLIAPTTPGYVAERWVLASMGVTLAFIFVWPDFFRFNDRFRLLGDAVFLFPGVLWIF